MMIHLSIKQKVIVLIAMSVYQRLWFCWFFNQHFRWENSAFRAASISSRDGDLELAGENAMKHMKP